MAEAPARSITDFKQNVKMPAQGPEGISNEAVVPSIAQQAPSSGEDLQRLVKFYKSIIALVSQYQTAFEKENYNRMGEYVIAINNALTDYFKRDKSEVKTALDDTINDITKKLSDKVNELSKKRSENALTSDEIKDGIVSTLDSYKDKIFRAVTALTTGRKAPRQPASGETPGAGQTGEQQRQPETSTADDLKAQTKAYALKASALAIRETNRLLNKQALVYNKQLLDFSADIGSKIVSSFREILSKVNVNNIGTLQKNLDKMQEAYDKNIFAVVERSGRAIRNSRNSAEQEAESRLKKSLKIALNTLTISLTGILGGFFLARSVIKATLLIGGKIVSVVGGILNFAKKIIVGAVKILAGTIKFALTVAYKTISIGVKAIKTVVVTTFNLSKFLYNKLQKLVGLDFWTLLGAFVMSYPGAYLLGYLSGRVWHMILNVAGITDEQIASGDYSVKDDVLMPFLQVVKKRFDDARKSIETFWNGGEDGQSFYDRVKNTILNLPIITRIKSFYNSVRDFVRSFDINSIRDTINTISIFFEMFVVPVVNALWSMIGMFVEGWIDEPVIAARAYVGARVGLTAIENLKKITRFGRFIIRSSKGGIAALVAGGVAAGAAAILGQSSEVKEPDEKEPSVMMLIKKGKFKELWSKHRPRTNAELVRDAFEASFKKINASGDKYEKQRYKVAVNAYSELLNERLNLKNLTTDLADFEEYWRTHKRDDGFENASLANTSLANQIIYYNGKPILPEGLSNVQGIPAQLAVLNAVLLSRTQDVEDKIDLFEKSLEFEEVIENGKSIKKGKAMDMDKLLRELDENKAYLPEYQKVATMEQEITMADMAHANGGTLKITLGGVYGNGLEEKATSDKNTQESVYSKTHAWEKGIDIGIKLQSGSSDIAGQLGESKHIKSESSNAVKNISEYRKNVFKANLEYDAPNRKLSPVLKRYYNFVRNDKRFRSKYVTVGRDLKLQISQLSTDDFFNSIYDPNLGPNSIAFQRFLLEDSEYSKEYIELFESKRSEISSHAQSYLLGTNIEGVLDIIRRILAVYSTLFMEDFTSFVKSKNLSSLNLSNVSTKLNEAIVKRFRVAMDDGSIEKDFLNVPKNEEALKNVLLSKANEIFEESINDIERSIDEVTTNAIKDFYSNFYEKNGENYLINLRQRVDIFTKEKALQNSLLVRVRELIEEGKEGKDDLKEQNEWETTPIR